MTIERRRKTSHNVLIDAQSLYLKHFGSHRGVKRLVQNCYGDHKKHASNVEGRRAANKQGDVREMFKQRMDEM